MYLESIKKANDIKNIPENAYDKLAKEIREFLIQKISVLGGHLGSNLGTVELTMALHLELNFPEDKLIWDVGHQAYTHKILTGRREEFDQLRLFGGMSGFPKRAESDCDAFDTGHSSTSISAGLGYVKARDLQKQKSTIISVIGDGSLTGGMAFEALNNAGKEDTNFIIILNDNNMSISENVGGIPKYLNQIRTSNNYLDLKEDVYKKLAGTPGGNSMVNKIRRAKNSFKSLMLPGMLFEEMGIVYLGPIDGHDIKAIRRAVQEAKRFKRAVLIHVITKKGNGFLPAERHPARFHGTGPFDIETGLPLCKKSVAAWTDIFSTVMCKLGARNEKVVAISAAMADGTGLKRFRNMYPDRFFDVGIAEEHAVTFAAGLSAGGLIPIVAIYSSFLQRAYDQILHDVCMQKLHVIFAIDRAGLVGNDGETHQGVFDLSYLSQMPNMIVMAPKNKWELSDMMKYAIGINGPVAIRYPRGSAYAGLEEFRAPIETGISEVIYREEEIALFAVGHMVEIAEQVYSLLKERGHRVSLINARFVKPIDEEAIIEAARFHDLLVTIEDNIRVGGYGMQVQDFIIDKGLDIDLLDISIPDMFVPHGDVGELRHMLHMDAEGICEAIENRLSGLSDNARLCAKDSE